MLRMDRNSIGSSVDPEDMTATVTSDQKSETFYMRHRDTEYSSNMSSNYSLSAMSDLEDDAVPCTPESSLPPGGHSQLSGGDNIQGDDTVSYRQGSTGSTQPIITQRPAAVSETPGNQHGDQAIPDDVFPLPRESSDNSLTSPCCKPKPELYDAVIFCHPDDKEVVKDFQNRLNQLVLFDEMPHNNNQRLARVAVEDDDASFGKGEISYFEQWLERAEIIFLYCTPHFFKDLECIFKVNVLLVESFFVENCKKEFVIPVFLENKFKMKHMSPSVRAIKGIDFIDCKWTDKIEKKIVDNLKSARRRRIQRENEFKMESGVAVLNLSD